MAGSPYILEVLLKARDEASAKIQALKRELDDLKASAAANDATSGLSKSLDDSADAAEHAADAHRNLDQRQQASARSARQSQSDIKRTAQLQEDAAEQATGHAESLEQLRRQSQLLPADMQGSEAAVKRVSEAHSDATEAVQQHTKAHGELSEGVGDSSDALERLRDDAQDASKAIRDVSENTGDLSDAQRELSKRTDEARSTFDELKTSLADGSGDLRTLRQDFQASGQELQTLSRRFQTTSSDARDLRDSAEEAAAIAKRLFTLEPSSRQPLIDTTGLDKAKQDLTQLTQQFSDFREAARGASSDMDQQINRLISRNFASQFSGAARQFDPGSTEMRTALSRSMQASSLARTAVSAPDPTAAASQQAEALVGRMRDLDQAARSGAASDAELRAGYSQVASGLRSLSKDFDVGSNEARKFGSAMDDAAAKAKNIDLARASTGIGQFAARFNQATDGIGIKIVSLSAELRGLRLAAIIGDLQPLDTGLVSLAGGLVSVASGAAQAAAALGGVFLSGLGQAIPVVSVAVAGIARLRTVLQALQASNQAQQQTALSPNQSAITELTNNNALIQSEEALTNAHHQLTDAQDAVTQSQLALNQARIDAIRNITDLRMAETSAQQTLEGANLSLVQAQQQEVAAQASGDQQQIQQAQLGVSQARLQQRQARLGVPRARQDYGVARREGVSGAPGVLSAAQGVRDARSGVTQAQQQVAESQRALRIQQLTNAEPSASSGGQAQSTLSYLKSRMSAPEKALFDSLQRLQNDLQGQNSPLSRIGDFIVQPFLNASNRLQQLLGDPSFLRPIDKLADSMGKALGRIEGATFGARGTSFFETMATDAAQNAPIITKSVTGIMGVFEDLAKAAEPAFRSLSQDWAQFWSELDRRDSSSQGQQQLTSFFDRGARWADDFAHLAGAVYDLFKAIGSDAAPQGMKTVDSLTGAIHDATNWVESHGPEVTRFFSQVDSGLGVIGSTLLTVGRAMVGAFSLGSLNALGSLLDEIVIPAIQNVTKVIGLLVEGLTDLVDFGFRPFGVEIRPIADILEGIATAFISLLVINRVVDAISKMTTAFTIAKAALIGFRDAEGGLLDKLKGGFSAGSDASKGLSVQSDGMQKAADTMQTAATEMGNAADKMATAAGDQDVAADKQTAAATQEEAAATEQMSAGAEQGIGGIGGAASSEAEGAEGGIEEGAAAGGLVSIGGRLIPAALAAYLGYQLGGGKSGWSVNHPGTTGSGLGSLVPTAGTHDSNNLGDIAGEWNPFGSHFNHPVRVSDQSAQTTTMLRTLQQGLTGVTNPAQLSTQRLRDLYAEVGKLSQQPDLTATQRRGLALLSAQLNPISVEMQKVESQWEQSFQGINATTGNVMQRVAQTIQSNIANISTNLGTGTTQGAAALSGTIQGAYSTVVGNTNLAAKGVQNGLRQINKMLNAALKQMGAPSLSNSELSSMSATQGMSWIQFQATGAAGSGTNAAGGFRASGGWNPSTPGGMSYTAGEAGYDEVTLTTDPKHAMRTNTLLSQFFERAPHMAEGGFVADPGTNFTYGQEPKIVTALTKLGDYLHTVVYGISGYRSPQHSAAVGGFSNDPHTRGQAADIGVGSSLRDSAAGVSNALLARFGLWRPFDMSGQDPAEVNHVQLLPALGGPVENGMTAPRSGLSTIGNAVANAVRTTAGARRIAAPHLHGLHGALGRIAQGSVDQATSAANSYLQSMGGSPQTGSGASGGSTSGLSGSLRQIVDQLARRFHWTGQVQQWLQVINRESGGSTTARNPSSGAYGIAQFIDGPSEYAQYGGNSTTMSGQLLAMANYIKSRYVDPAGAWAHELSAGWYAKGGRIGRALRSFAGGGIAPWGGRPVALIAHEGERIMNPAQYGEVARMAGTTPSALDAHMGYDGTPKQSFVNGGVVMPTGSTAERTSSLSTSSATIAALNAFLTSIAGNLFTMDPGSLSSALSTISNVFKRVTAGFAAIGNLGGSDTSSRLSQINSLVEALDNTTDGLLTQLTNAFQRFQNNLSNWVTRVSNRVTAASPSAVAGQRGKLFGTGSQNSGAYGGVSMAGPALDARDIGDTGQSEIDKLTLSSLVQQGQYIATTESTIKTAIAKIKSSIARVRSSHAGTAAERDRAIKDLESRYTDLVQQLENWQNSMNENVTSRLQQEQTIVQDNLGQISDVYDTQQSQLQGRQEIAQTKGNMGQVASLDRQLGRSATRQLAALQPALKEAEKINDPDLVAQIKQQMAQLQETAGQAAVQALTDAQTGIEQSAQTRQAGIQTRQQIAQATGNYSELPSIDTQMASAANAEISKLQGVLAKAKAKGDTSVVQQIQQEIDQLQATAAQAAVQALQDAETAIDNAAQTSQAGIQSQQQIAQAYGNLSQLPSLDQAMSAAAQAQINALEPIMQAAQAQGDTGTVQQIQQEIDQLQASVAQAAAQMIQDQISAIQQTSQTQQAQVSEYQSIAQTLQGAASTPGQFAAAGSMNAQALSLNQSSLQSQLSSYNSLLGQASAQGNTGAVATITQTIDQLTAELASNTQALTDNTAQVVQETSQFIQARGQFVSGVYGGLGQIIQTIGQTTGYTNVGALAGATQASTGALQSTNSGLLGQLGQLGGGASSIASMLQGITDPMQFVQLLSGANISGAESGQDSTWIQSFESIIQSLETNTEAIATNNQQLATLNGQLLQPQSWASMTWSTFRTAVFSGMGNLLPSYQSALTGTAIPTVAPTFSQIATGQQAPTIGSLHITSPTTVLDPQVLGQQLQHELSVTP